MSSGSADSTSADHGVYCVEGCGRPATYTRPLGMSGDTPVTELVCLEHADDTSIPIPIGPTP